jgi:hypothetical protein
VCLPVLEKKESERHWSRVKRNERPRSRLPTRFWRLHDQDDGGSWGSRSYASELIARGACQSPARSNIEGSSFSGLFTRVEMAFGR